ncbi:MAG: 30S ribosomal protein S11 [Candidatus Uhrbacteria bacterium GW2011_GWE2_45_35]|uniref:Small ribosomal subunit protein uS11 n=2 Tax=Candidatus Uhriibacteriota TaxID=1752732 RepID=A0A0G1JK77_9BACT|nr:MAG: 30S ribosomal protein S11 [Candidatus Uhrbacteria bacterium GW2011_GWF2_44_350]KKU08737.1 MAG: 30S ribosomal protein S11 [Candidatus Uhrbacteria bacterium GW2011_GWE2_45_35]HBR80755.1 30S ribosomal protein S11 [Candidatus Uhrbacteria bacterium]HCU31882.1 30S ribosomal protein S11 [Candidatus Uhrbacteria bacterium]
MADEVKKESATPVETKVKKPLIKKGAKKKTIQQVSHGRAYVHATFNNTIITLTDANGNTLAWASSGHCGFKGPKKATPYAAGVVVKAVVEKVAPYGLQEVNVFLQGVGSGRDAAVRAFNANGLTVLSIKDMTPLPHNGCRLPRARRI